MLILDTCVLIYDALTPTRMSNAAKKAIRLAEKKDELACSDISLWEIAMLVMHGRLKPGTETIEFIRLVLSARNIRVLPITPEIAVQSTTLPLHGDPADRLIAATTNEYESTLVTSDDKLRNATCVNTLW